MDHTEILVPICNRVMHGRVRQIDRSFQAMLVIEYDSAIEGPKKSSNTRRYYHYRGGCYDCPSLPIGHADLKSMEPYQHQELEPLRMAINQRSQRKKFGQVLEMKHPELPSPNRYLLDS